MRKGEATKQHIARAALLLFAEKGIPETTTRDIAAAAGVAEGTIYRHFDSKEEIAHVLFTDQHTRLADALEQAQAAHDKLPQKTDALVRAFCSMAEADWPLFTYYLLNMHRELGKVAPDTPNPVHIVRQTIQTAMANGEIPIGDPEILTSMVMGIIIQPALHKVYGHLQSPLSDHTDMFFTAALNILQVREK